MPKTRVRFPPGLPKHKPNSPSPRAPSHRLDRRRMNPEKVQGHLPRSSREERRSYKAQTMGSTPTGATSTSCSYPPNPHIVIPADGQNPPSTPVGINVSTQPPTHESREGAGSPALVAQRQSRRFLPARPPVRIRPRAPSHCSPVVQPVGQWALDPPTQVRILPGLPSSSLHRHSGESHSPPDPRGRPRLDSTANA